MNARHWRNLAAQLLILLTMAIVAAIDVNIYIVLISVSLLILPPINWTVAGVLLWTSRQDPTVRSLADAADNALTWAVNATVAAAVGALVLLKTMGILTSPVGAVITVLLGFIVATSSLPAFRFLQTWREVWMPMIRRGGGD